jgi:helix-turn-helix protein
VTPPLDRFEFERLIRDLGLSTTQLVTAYALCTFINGDGTNAHPGVTHLSKATGLHRATVIRALGDLEDMGLLNAVSRGGAKGIRKGAATVYELATPVDNHRAKHRKPGTL